VAYLSEKMNCPIVPVYLGGIWKMNPWNFLKRKVKITISFGKPLWRKDIFTNQHPGQNHYKAGSAVIMSKIAELKLVSQNSIPSPFFPEEKEKIKAHLF
jgi:hypothetical protein